MDKRQKIFQDAEKIVEFIDECVKKGYFPSDDDIIFHFKLSDRMLEPRLELVWKIHKSKPNRNWEIVLDDQRKKREEEWKKLDVLEEIERRNLEKLELQKQMEQTKDPSEKIALMRRLRYFDQNRLAIP